MPLSTALACGPTAFAKDGTALNVNVIGIKQSSASVVLVMFDNQDGFSKQRPTARAMKAVIKSIVTVSFANLGHGECAVELFDIQNENKTLDLNAFDIPSKLYQFSNNAIDPFSTSE